MHSQSDVMERCRGDYFAPSLPRDLVADRIAAFIDLSFDLLPPLGLEASCPEFDVCLFRLIPANMPSCDAVVKRLTLLAVNGVVPCIPEQRSIGRYAIC